MSPIIIHINWRGRKSI